MTTESTLFADAEMVDMGDGVPIHNNAPAPSTNMDAAHRTSFTADTPYYTSYVEKEMQQVQILSETLKDISGKAKTFGKCGALMAESTRRLSSACRLERLDNSEKSDDEGEESMRAMEKEERAIQERREAVGEDMSSVLRLLAEVLDEIANAQVQMCESLEASLVITLESFADTEMNQVSSLKTEAEVVTDSAENAFSRYMNGRHADKLTDPPIESWNKMSESVSGQISSTVNKWKSGDLLQTNNATDRQGLKNWRSSSHGAGGKDDTAPPPSSSSRRNRSGGTVDPSLQQASTAANLQLTLEQVRLAQASAELKRFQLLKKLVSIKKRRNFELGESALASLHGIRAYFNNCSDLVQGLAPRLNRIQSSQSLSREKHDAQQAPWESRESGLVQAMTSVGRAVDMATLRAESIPQSSTLEDFVSQTTTLNGIEQETQIWNLPQLLAESSRYQRDAAPGVLVEGWLYKKSSSRMALQQWSRRWFMMNKDGIYYFHSTTEQKKNTSNNGYLHTLERVKICDTVLCMVRELKNDGLRFRFEIVTPNQRPLQLQARGPEDYKMWVNGIRLGAQNQLVHGDVSPDALMQGLGKKKKKRGGSGDNGGGEGVTTLASMVETEPSRSSSSEEAATTTTEVPTPQFREHDYAVPEEDYNATKTTVVEESSGSKRPLNPVVQEILDANPVCADCGKASPDWACINLGVLVCIECSGVHRSLGVHLSKVRSVRMDALSDSECRLLLSLGNERVNPIWEAGIESQRGWKKPTGDDSRKVKEEWIKSKYQWKGFLEVDSSTTHDDRLERVNRELYEAASQGNLMGAAEALAHGGNVDWKNPLQGGKTPLHAVATSKPPSDDFTTVTANEEWRGIECAELLLQNGAKMKAVDDNHQSPLDCAVIGGAEREMIEFLSARAS